MSHPAAIVYRAEQTHPVKDKGKLYFGHTMVSQARTTTTESPENRALRRRQNQHYYAARKGKKPTPFQKALRKKNKRGEKMTRFSWTIEMVVYPPVHGADSGNADIKWCAEVAEGWHIDHFQTDDQECGYNRQLPPAVQAIVQADQPMLMGRNNQYRGCRFQVPPGQGESMHPEDAIKRVARSRLRSPRCKCKRRKCKIHPA